MASILFNNNNDNDPLKGKTPETGIQQSVVAVVTGKTESPAVVKKEDDFAIFPQWDVVPPNAIINPRIKKNI